MNKLIPTKQVLDRANIPPATLSSWTSKYGLPYVKKGNRYQYPDDVVQVIEVIRSLKSEGYGDATITRKLGYSENVQETFQEEEPLSEDTQKHSETFTEHSVNHSDSPQTFLTIVEDTVNKNMSAVLELTEKLNTAYREIGSLESNLKHAEDKLRLLPHPEEFLSLKIESEQLSEQLAQKNLEIEQLKQINEDIMNKQNQAKQHWLIRLMFKELF